MKKQINVKVSEELHAQIKQAAKSSGFNTISAWLTSILLDVIKRQKRKDAKNV